MSFVFAVLAVGLAIAAARVSDKATRIFLVACCALNIAGAIATIAREDRHAFRLMPNDGRYEPSYRR